MNESLATPEAQPELFYELAIKRVARSMSVLLFVGLGILWVLLGRAFAISFLLGGVIALLNFYWLKRLVVVFADKVVGTGEARGSSGMVVRFLLRYGLIAAAAYVIFRGSAVSAYGLFAGLFLPVPAILLEALYEAFVAFRRGT